MTSLSFFSLISGLIGEANQGLHEALDTTSDQPVQFVIPKIEMDIKCFIISDSGVKVVPSNAESQTYYGKDQESLLRLTFKLKP
jgi:hypothetical protein